MLVLTRKLGEAVVIGENADIKLFVLGVRENQVRLGFEADPEIQVHREEIYQKIRRERLHQLVDRHTDDLADE